jgi:methionine synthase II (cobalamin-independent)
MIGRTTAVLHALAVDLQPAGWRLNDGSGREHRQARATLRSDLDQLEEQAQGFRGEVKLSLAGPWTLAATIERRRGDRVLADSGARRELGQSLAEGLVELLGELARRLPPIHWVVQLDEPMLPAVMAGSVSTASGLGRHRVVDSPEVSGAYSYLVERLRHLAAEPAVLVHCCAAGAPVSLLRGAGIVGVLLDVGQCDHRVWDEVGEAIEAGSTVGLGVVATGPGRGDPPTARRAADRALRPLRALGLGPDVTGQLLLTPACGLAGMQRAEAVRLLRPVRDAAEIVTEDLGR